MDESKFCQFWPKIGETVLIGDDRYKITNIFKKYPQLKSDCPRYAVQRLRDGKTAEVFRHMMTSIRWNEHQVPRPQKTLNDSWDDPDLDLVLSQLVPEPNELAAFQYQELPDGEPTSERFRSATEDEIRKCAESVEEESTKRSTKWGVKLFQEWLLAKNFDVDFEERYDDARLDMLLKQFYVEARTTKGQNYSRSALLGIRAAINRHLHTPPFNRLVDLGKDKSFQSSNAVLKGILKINKRAGLDMTKHKEALCEADIKKMYTTGCLGNESPISLQRKVWYEITLHFGRRGQEGLLRALNKDSFVLKTDGDGFRYFTNAYNEADKTHHGVDSRENNKANRMYETSNDPENCPVNSLVKYLTKLNGKCDALFQRPITIANAANYDSTYTWYANAPMGHVSLSKMMSNISNDAGLSQRYTNHCVRATCCTILGASGISTINIMSVSGHRNEASLQSYISGPSMAQKRTMSNILQNNCSTPTSTSTITSSDTDVSVTNNTQASTSPPSLPIASGPMSLPVSAAPCNYFRVRTGPLSLPIASEPRALHPNNTQGTSNTFSANNIPGSQLMGFFQMQGASLTHPVFNLNFNN